MPFNVMPNIFPARTLDVLSNPPTYLQQERRNVGIGALRESEKNGIKRYTLTSILRLLKLHLDPVPCSNQTSDLAASCRVRRGHGHTLCAFSIMVTRTMVNNYLRSPNSTSCFPSPAAFRKRAALVATRLKKMERIFQQEYIAAIHDMRNNFTTLEN